MDDGLKVGLGALTAIVALATAVVSFSKERLKNEGTSTPTSIRLIQITRTARRRWPWVLFRWSCIPLAIVTMAFLVKSVDLFITYPSFSLGLSCAWWILCIITYIYAFLKLRVKPWERYSATRQQVEVTLEGSYDDISSRCHFALKKLKARIVSFDREKGHIVAHTPWSWRSFGEEIEIDVKKTDDNCFSIAISSDSILPTTMIDYGKNSRNLDSIISSL